jgi:hypothetical protein
VAPALPDSDRRVVGQSVIESITAPERLRRKRRWWRRFALAGFVGVAGWLVYSGHRGLQIDFLPAQYLGYLLFAFATLGAAGINIWYGGPLDPRFDPLLSDDDTSEADSA